jgi:nucleotide-binding universal stress UspA family protein
MDDAPMDDAPILICYDDSTNARHAINVAATLLVDRRAVVLDVAPELTVAESYAALGAVTPNFEELNADDGLARAHVGAELARSAGFIAEARAEVAAPTWDGVVEVADEIGAAAIVLGSRGLTGARELLKGSFSHEVAEHAGRPVLIVPPPRAAGKQSSGR